MLIKRIILIRPPLELRDDSAITDINYFFPPAGLALLSALLKANGYDVCVEDMYDYSWQKVKDFFISKEFDLVGITCFSGQHFSALKLAGIAKEAIKPALVVLGGPHSSAKNIDTQIISNYKEIDFIVRGEGEKTILELLEALNRSQPLNHIKGLTFKSNDGQLVRTPDSEAFKDLDSLPFPDYSFLDFEKTENVSDGKIDIADKKRISRFAPVVTSRGCPNRCQFCALFMGREVRFRSPENVVDEIEKLAKTYKITHFSFVDDCFNASLDRAEKICALIIERKLSITWTAMARVKPLSENFLRLAKRSGCLALNFGVESGSKIILKTISKNIELDDFVNAIRMVKRAGINSAALFMVGNPGENNETVKETIKLIKRAAPYRIVVSPLIVLPNSELHDLALKQGFISDDFWLKNNKPVHYTFEHGLDELRFFRLKILFFHYFYRKQLSMAIKLAILILGYKFVKLFNLKIDDVRDWFLRIPLFNFLLKRMKTA